MNTTPQPPINTSSCADNVLARIEREGVCPRSRSVFILQNGAFWVLFAGSIILGALSVAVLNVATMHGMYGFFEATHERWESLVVSLLPPLWLIVFILMIGLAYLNLRCTKMGYRYPLWQIIIGSLLLSLVGGIVLYWMGVGHALDRVLQDRMPGYTSQETRELSLWQQPQNGRMVGFWVETDGGVFQDTQGERWELVTEDLMSEDIALLESGETVRLLGVQVGTSSIAFHTCGVFPWLSMYPRSISELNAERKAFLERIYRHKQDAIERLEALSEATYGTAAESPPMGKCAELPIMPRIEKGMPKS